jgi:putative solute:sodium symporter small subunit
MRRFWYSPAYTGGNRAVKEGALHQSRTQQHWQRTRRLSGWLLAIWFVVTFAVSGYARELQSVSVLGFPLPFYMGAQGALLIYVLLVGFYAWRMGKLDDECAGDDGRD